MTVLPSARGLANTSGRRPGRVVGAWLAVLVLSVFAIVAFFGEAFSTDSDVTNDPESQRAYDLLEERLPPDPDFVSELVIVRSPAATIDEPAFRAKVEEIVRTGEEAGAIAFASTYYRDRDAALVSPDRHATVIGIGLGTDPESKAEELIEIVQAADGKGGFDVSVTGEWVLDHDVLQLIFDGLKKGELYFGLPVALVIVVLVFGTVVAGLVPVGLALISIIAALGLTVLIGQAFELSTFVLNMIAAMGLALGIDYCLFVLSRYREERAHGRPKLDAIEVSGATASRAVLFSGMAFVLAMLGMVLVPDTTLRSLAIGAILVGLVSMLAALTLLPAVLSLLGDRVNALRVPVLGRAVERQARGESRFWSAIATRVMRRPLVSLVVTAALLLAAAAPVFALNTGEPGVATLPDDVPSKQGFVALSEEFGVGTVDDAEVVIDGDVSSGPVRAAVGRLETAIARDPAFRRPTVDTYEQENLAVVSALLVGDSRSDRAIDAVKRLRAEHVPRAFAGVNAEVLVTGETAETIDYKALVARWIPLVFTFVLGLTLILLTVAFRSVVVAVKAVLLNLLSVGAAYGLIVLVFQKGIGNELFGFRQTEIVTAWVPLFLFSVLFGLSMDYHVFLLSRIRERFLQTGDSSEAVAFGIGSTARLITGAALIIIAVWIGFALGDTVELQQAGFGVAVALLIDATIVRSVLVPAAMELLGKRNWYFPRWLGWLPDVGLEGAEPAQRPARPVSS